MYEYSAHVIRVIDGDTFEMDVDLGFRIHIRIRLRLLSCDTPEIKGEEKVLGCAVRDHVKQLIEDKDVVICSYKDTEDVDTDSFGRWLCHVKFNRPVNEDGPILRQYDLAGYLTSIGVNKKIAYLGAIDSRRSLI